MADIDYWIAGFVDGEGCFSLAINSHSGISLGFQIQAEFAVTQSESSIDALNVILDRLQCGYIQLNKRNDNHHESLLIYRVRKINDLVTESFLSLRPIHYKLLRNISFISSGKQFT